MLFLSCFLLCFCAHLLIDALWSPAGKGLTSWLSFVMSNCEVVTFPLVPLVRCDTRLLRFLVLISDLCTHFITLHFKFRESAVNSTFTTYDTLSLL